MKLTTGFDFQGYVVTEYIDVLFDEMIVGIGFGKAITSSIDNFISKLSGSEATELIDKLNEVKRALRRRVEAQAAAMGANALLGVDFESSKLGELIMVSMTATAVRIEKLADFNPNTEEKIKAKQKEERLLKERELRWQVLAEARGGYNEENSPLKQFVGRSLGLSRFTEINKVWEEEKDTVDAVIAEEVEKELNSRVSIERMYGGTDEKKIEEFLAFVSQIGK